MNKSYSVIIWGNKDPKPRLLGTFSTEEQVRAFLDSRKFTKEQYKADLTIQKDDEIILGWEKGLVDKWNLI